MKVQAAKLAPAATGAPPGTRRAAAKAATRARLVRTASRLMRRRGLGAASVPRVMRGAGLTVGGFYAHFASKAAMAEEVLRVTLEQVRGGWFADLDAEADPVWMYRAVRRYLHPAHRDDAEAGCPLPAVLSELTWASPRARAVLAEALEAAAAALAPHAPATDAATARQRALATIALCVGGLTIARATRGHAFSDELLTACARWAVPELAGRPR